MVMDFIRMMGLYFMQYYAEEKTRAIFLD